MHHDLAVSPLHEIERNSTPRHAGRVVETQGPYGLHHVEDPIDRETELLGRDDRTSMIPDPKP